MRPYTKLIISLLAALAGLGLFTLWLDSASPALADTKPGRVIFPVNNLVPLQQTDPCTTTLFDWTGAGSTLDWTINEVAGGTVDLSYNDNALELFQTGNGLSGLVARSPSINHVVQSGDDFVWSSEQINSQVSLYVRLFFSDDSNTYAYDSGTQNAYAPITRTFDLEPYVGLTLLYIEVRNTDIQNGDRTVRLFWMSIANEFGDCEEEPSGSELCPLVENANFAAETGWLVAGGAVITDGILTLPAAGQAAQNLTLASGTTYNAVLSTTTSYSGSTSIDMTLGTSQETVEITGTGRFTTSFTTPSLGGPVAYGLENVGAGSVELDFTCLYTDTGGQVVGDCIAPINGTFDTADDWTYLRDASWYSPAKEAALPASTVALLVSSSVYSLPTLTTGENLLLSFTSRKLSDDTGAVMGRVKGVSGVNFTYEVYPTDYTFETSLNSLAGEDSVEVAFVNPGLEGSTIFSSTADIALDNVCIFVTDRGPNLPTPTDPNAIPGVDLGFNWTSCLAIDGILAGFGVNMAQYRAEYEAGASVWDPIGWVPWLISALWVTLATYLCVFMAAFVTLVDILEYLINNILNVSNWWTRGFPDFVLWISRWLIWLYVTADNINNAYWQFIADWVVWAALSINLVNAVISVTMAAAVVWLALSLSNMFLGYGVFFLSWFLWGSDSTVNIITWLGRNLLAMSVWWAAYLLGFNGLRVVVNWLIDNWNTLTLAIGTVISLVIQLAVDIWDTSILPVLQIIWDYLSSFSLIALVADVVIDFVIAAFNLFWMVSQWIWENVFMVVSLPFQVYYGFTEGTQSAAFDALIACSAANWFCTLLAGLQIVNQTVGATILYPIVIAGIIIATIGIFWRSIWKMFTIEIA